jgi:hypothetical protein
MAWLQSWLFLAPLVLADTLLFLLFPNGRLLSRRWLPVLWLVILGMALALVGEMFTPHVLEGFESLKNPYAARGSVADVMEVLANIAFVLMFVGIVVSAASLVVRFRRGSRLERQQLKWVTSAACLVGVAFASGPVVLWYVAEAVWEPVLLFTIATIPVAAGVAILRYRLYEIDRVISRTVSYVIVIVLLALVYGLAVTGLTTLLDTDSPLVVAGSTLAVAALFNPLRRRVQRWVDHRFNRTKYDSELVVARFTGSLRDEVDPDRVTDGWVSVVNETMHPASAGVWVRV